MLRKFDPRTGTISWRLDFSTANASSKHCLQRDTRGPAATGLPFRGEVPHPIHFGVQSPVKECSTNLQTVASAFTISSPLSGRFPLPNALVQLQAQYNHCGEVAFEKCLSAATSVRRRAPMGSAPCPRLPEAGRLHDPDHRGGLGHPTRSP